MIPSVWADDVIIDSTGRNVGLDQTVPPGNPEKKISIDFQNADIHAGMAFFAKSGDTNIIVDESIKGTVTMRVEGVTWSEAFLAVCWSKGLVAMPMQSMYFVSSKK